MKGNANRLIEYFPDGTAIDEWFYETTIPEPSALGKPYVLTDYGILADGRLHTGEIQRLIEQAAEAGGGVIVVPAGVYLTGSLLNKAFSPVKVGENALFVLICYRKEKHALPKGLACLLLSLSIGGYSVWLTGITASA